MTHTLNYHLRPARNAGGTVRRWLRRLTFAVTVVALLICVGLWRDTWHRARLYQQAVRHVPAARAAIAGDPRFTRVTVDASNGKYGVALWASGTVASIQDRAAVERAISGTRPPVRVSMSVFVDPPLPTISPTTAASSPPASPSAR